MSHFSFCSIDYMPVSPINLPSVKKYSLINTLRLLEGNIKNSVIPLTRVVPAKPNNF